MKLLGLEILTWNQLRKIRAEEYERAIQDIKEILRNKDKHIIFFDDVIITGKKLRLKNLTMLGSVTAKFNSTTSIDNNLTLR